MIVRSDKEATRSHSHPGVRWAGRRCRVSDPDATVQSDTDGHRKSHRYPSARRDFELSNYLGKGFDAACGLRLKDDGPGETQARRKSVRYGPSADVRLALVAHCDGKDDPSSRRGELAIHTLG